MLQGNLAEQNQRQKRQDEVNGQQNEKQECKGYSQGQNLHDQRY
jgi:hypothetical protein